MGTQLEDVELELKRTRLAREQLALSDDLKKRERADRAVQAVGAVGAAGLAGAKAARGSALRVLLFMGRFLIATALGYIFLVANDPAKVGGSADFRMGYYFFWAVGVGLILALITYPWKNGGALTGRKLFRK